MSDAYRYCTYIGMAQDLIILPRAIVDLFQALPKGCNTYTYVGVKTTYTPRFVKPKFPGTAQSRINVAKVPKNNGEVRGFNYAMGKHDHDAERANKSKYSIPNEAVKTFTAS
jgi:hypothetical protein